MTHALRVAAGLVLAFAGACRLAQPPGRPSPAGPVPAPTRSAPGFLVIAHRAGGRVHAPDNSLPNIRYAIEHGFAAIEVDLRRTRDGQIVLWHDATFPRRYLDPGAGEGETAAWSDVSWADGQKIRYAQDVGGRRWDGLAVLTWDDLVRETRGRINLVLDKKESVPIDVLIEHVRQAGIGRQTTVMFNGKDPEVARKIGLLRAGVPEASVIVGTGGRFDDAFLAGLAAAGADLVFSPDTAEEVAALHRHGLLACAGHAVVREFGGKDAGLGALLALGIDAAIADDPLRLKQAVAGARGPQVLAPPAVPMFDLLRRH